MKKRILFTIACGIIVACMGCGKDFLDIKRQSNQVVPRSVEDYQALLDNSSVMNNTSLASTMIAGDEHYATAQALDALSVSNGWQRYVYLWQPDAFGEDDLSDWNNPYQRILYANLSLDVERLHHPSDSRGIPVEIVKGRALFHRAWNYWQLAQTFVGDYSTAGGITVRGIPLRTDYDITVPVVFSTAEEVYHQIVTDAEEAERLLDNSILNKFQPSKTAAQMLLARIELYLGNYEKALDWTDSVLEEHNGLLPYHTIDASPNYPFLPYRDGIGNPEVIFYCNNLVVNMLNMSRLNVDTIIYNLMDDNDLRKNIYFRRISDNEIRYKGSYTGGGTYFTGLALDEIYLIRAECLVRLGHREKADIVLNSLREVRFMPGDANRKIDLYSMNDSEALSVVLLERRKQMYMRGLRWSDLKRLNRIADTRQNLYRIVDGELYELSAGDSRWALDIPVSEIDSW